MEVVVQRSPFPQKFRRKEDIVSMELLPHLPGIAHRHSGFDDHHSPGVDIQDFLNDRFHRRGIEEILLGIIIGGRGDDDIFCMGKSIPGIQGSPETDVLPLQEPGNVRIHQRRLPLVQHLYFFRYNVQRHHFLVLGQQEPVGKAHIPCTCNRDFHEWFSFPAIILLYHKKGAVKKFTAPWVAGLSRVPLKGGKGPACG